MINGDRNRVKYNIYDKNILITVHRLKPYVKTTIDN